MQQDVAQTIIAVGDARRRVIGRQVLGQPLRQQIHRRHVLHARGLPLTSPQRHLALHIALWPAEALESDRAPIHPVQGRKHAGKVLINRGAVCGTLLTHDPVREDPPRNVIHDEKRCTEHRFVIAEQLHARHGNIGFGQRGHHAVLARHLVRPRQQLAGWLLAQHVVAAGGLQMKRGIALAALKLSNLQLTVESGQPATQVPSQRRFVESMRRQYRHQLCHPRHLWPLVVDRVCENPTEEQ